MELDPPNATFRSNLAKAEKAFRRENSESALADPKTVSGNAPKVLQPQESDPTPRTSSSLSETVVDTEAEPAYWVFDRVPSPGCFQQKAASQVSAVEETLLTERKPSLDSAPQTHGCQALFKRSRFDMIPVKIISMYWCSFPPGHRIQPKVNQSIRRVQATTEAEPRKNDPAAKSNLLH